MAKRNRRTKLQMEHDMFDLFTEIQQNGRFPCNTTEPKKYAQHAYYRMHDAVYKKKTDQFKRTPYGEPKKQTKGAGLDSDSILKDSEFMTKPGYSGGF